jgi:hypothetical protein
MSSKTSQFLFHGELSDAPGRDESWDEYVRFLGNNRWKLVVEGTDFAGLATAPPVSELMSTKSIVNWVLERDAEEDDEADDGASDSEEDDSTSPRKLGPRSERLREIALSEGASYCVSCLDGWLSEDWPPKLKQARVKILEIKGLTQRGIWIRIYHTGFDVETNLGSAFMYPPNGEHVSRIVLKTEGSMSPGRLVKVPKVFWQKIEALKQDSTASMPTSLTAKP